MSSFKTARSRVVGLPAGVCPVRNFGFQTGFSQGFVRFRSGFCRVLQGFSPGEAGAAHGVSGVIRSGGPIIAVERRQCLRPGAGGGFLARSSPVSVTGKSRWSQVSVTTEPAPCRVLRRVLQDGTGRLPNAVEAGCEIIAWDRAGFSVVYPERSESFSLQGEGVGETGG